MLRKGTSYVDTFRNADDPLLTEIWKQRIEPYLDSFPSVKLGLKYTFSQHLIIHTYHCRLLHNLLIPYFLG